MIKSIYSNLLPKAVLLSVFLSPGYVISKASAITMMRAKTGMAAVT